MKIINTTPHSGLSCSGTLSIKGILVLICLMIITISSHSQQLPELKYKNELRLGIVQIFFGTMHLNYEIYTENYNSVSLVIEATYNKKKDNEVTGIYAEIQPRIYILKYGIDEFSDFSIEGIYFSPAVKYGSKKIVDNEYDDSIDRFGVNLILGIKNNILSRLSLDINAGCGFTKSDIHTKRASHEYDLNVFSRGYTGFTPVGNITFGFKF
jgi:hypothetical protein